MKNWSFERVLLVIGVIVIVGQSIYLYSVTQRHQRQINEMVGRTQDVVNSIEGVVQGIESERALDSVIIDSLIRERKKENDNFETIRNNPTNLDVLGAEDFFARRYGPDPVGDGQSGD